MKVIQCENHHYYDSLKYDSCPYCKREEQSPQTDDGEDKTVSFAEDGGEEQITVAFSEDVMPDEDKTIGIYQRAGQVQCVTGWLVCVKGVLKGAAYQLGPGRNFIGRALDMDIALSEDLLVSRVNHMAVVYDDRNCIFYAVPGTGPVRLEEDILDGVRILKEDMVLEIGGSHYQFVPYCNGRRRWE